MVFVGHRTGEEREDSRTSQENSFMAMGTERSRSNLHNFSLPCLKWGEQRQLRCVKVDGGGGDHVRALNRRSLPTTSNPGGETRKPPEPNRKRRSAFESESFERSTSRFKSPPGLRQRPSVSDYDDGIEAVRKKIILDLRTQMDRMKSAVLSEGSEDIETPPAPTRTEAPSAEEPRPWNLRTRRAVCKEPNATGGKTRRVDERKSNFSPATTSIKSPTRRSDVGGGEDGGIGGEKKPRAKFRVPLCKQEIEEDFIAMTGTRPPRMPKKRPRNVQRQIDRLFPGLWLSEIKPAMYKVNENADGGKN